MAFFAQFGTRWKLMICDRFGTLNAQIAGSAPNFDFASLAFFDTLEKRLFIIYFHDKKEKA